MELADAVTALEARFLEAYRRGDATASVDVYTDDAVYLTPGRPAIRGRKAIQAATAEDIAARLKVAALTPFHMEQSGDLGYVLENCDTSAGAVTTMLALRREADGRWRIYAEAIVPS